MRYAFGLMLWAGCAWGQAGVPVVVTMACDATYSETATSASLNARCSGLGQPFGPGTMTIALSGRLSSAGAVSGIGGTVGMAFGGGMGLEAVVEGASARASGTSGMVIVLVVGVRQGSGAMAGASGTLTLTLDGVSEKAGTARVSVSGSGSVSAPGLKPPGAVPGGPGVLGSPMETGGASCGDPVTVTNGNMYHRFADVAGGGLALPLRLERTYNSQAAAVDGPLGYGWTHNYRETLRGTGPATVLDGGTGSAVVVAAMAGGKVEADGSGTKLTAADGTVRRFSASGRLEGIEDSNGNRQALSYDGAGRLVSVVDGAGGQLRFGYNGAGRMVWAEDRTGQRASYEYDGAGNLTAATGAGGVRTAFEYANHLMTKMARAGEGEVSFEYGMEGKAARNVRQDGTAVEFEYGSGKTVVKAGGLETVYEYNAAGQVTGVLQGAGAGLRQVWSGARLVETVDELGQSVKLGYDGAGRMVSRTDGKGGVLKFGYDEGSGRVKWFMDAAGNRTEYEYDAKGNRVAVRDAAGGERRLKYDSRGLVTEERGADGRVVSAAYDEAGNAVEQRDAAGVVWKAKYDAGRRVVSLTGPAGVEKQFERDAAGRVLKETDGVMGTTTRSYDAAGRLTGVSGGGQPAAEYGYDGAGRFSTVKNALGEVFRYEYGADGRLAALVDGGGGRREFGYDAAGRVVSEKAPDGGEAAWVWNARGDLITRKLAGGREVKMEYDAGRRLVRRVGADGEEETFAYDERGLLAVASNEWVTLYMAYDALGRVVSVTDSRGPYTVSYTYDGAGRRKSVTAPGGEVVEYGYDAAGRLSAVKTGEREYGIEYGENRQRSRMVYAGGLVATYGYDAAGRGTRVSYGTTVVYGAEYDSMGNRVGASGPEGVHRYEYDGLKRVVAAAHPTLGSESFAYDATGRRVARETGVTVELDGLGRVKAATAADGRVVLYRWDALGRLIEREEGGVVRAWVNDGERALVELEGGAVKWRRTYAGGELLEEERADGVYQYLLDLWGNVGAVARMKGAGLKARGADEVVEPEVVETHEYKFDGEVVGATGGFAGFQQGMVDAVTGLKPSGGGLLSVLSGILGTPVVSLLGNLLTQAGQGGNMDAAALAEPWAEAGGEPVSMEALKTKLDAMQAQTVVKMQSVFGSSPVFGGVKWDWGSLGQVGGLLGSMLRPGTGGCAAGTPSVLGQLGLLRPPGEVEVVQGQVMESGMAELQAGMSQWSAMMQMITNIQATLHQGAMDAANQIRP